MSLHSNSRFEGNPSGVEGIGRRRLKASSLQGSWSCSAGTYQLQSRVTHCSSSGVFLKGFSSPSLSGSVFLKAGDRAGTVTYTDEKGRDGCAVLDVDHGQQTWQMAFSSTRET